MQRALGRQALPKPPGEGVDEMAVTVLAPDVAGEVEANERQSTLWDLDALPPGMQLDLFGSASSAAETF